MPVLYLLRHAESEANLKGVLAGRDNSVNLSANGFKDARKVAKELNKLEFKSIYSSPITRCQQTIEPLIQGLKEKQVQFAAKFKERMVDHSKSTCRFYFSQG
jgi:probable phosphoglycerate mutase